MKTDYKNSSNKSGVYQIRNLINGKVYIGSAKDFHVRFSQHLNSLKKNKHQNKHLQSAFNQDGEDAFIFEVLKVMEDSIKEHRFKVEQEYINKYFEHWEACYNFKKQTIQKERTCFSKTRSPEEVQQRKSEILKERWKNKYDEMLEIAKCNTSSDSFKEKCSVRMKKYWAEITEEENREISRKLSVAVTGFKHSEEAKKKMSKSKEKVYHLIDPDGKTIEIRGLMKWCKKNNINYHSLYNVIYGSCKQYKGYKKCQ